MRVKFLKDCEYEQIIPLGQPNAGKRDPDRSKSYKAGEEYDMPDDHANRWLRRNAAVVVSAAAASGGKRATAAMVPAPPVKGE